MAKCTDAATREHSRRAAHRAADNPKMLARAVGVVTAAVADERLSLEEHIQRVVEQAPPLSAAQRDRLAALLRPAERGSAD